MVLSSLVSSADPLSRDCLCYDHKLGCVLAPPPFKPGVTVSPLFRQPPRHPDVVLCFIPMRTSCCPGNLFSILVTDVLLP
jgi:hypothetical protein